MYVGALIMGVREAEPVDEALRIEEGIKDEKIKGIRYQASQINTSNPSGICWACDAETGHDRRWCSVECRDIWDNDQ
jgi:hypothetical protein